MNTEEGKPKAEITEQVVNVGGNAIGRVKVTTVTKPPLVLRGVKVTTVTKPPLVIRRDQLRKRPLLVLQPGDRVTHEKFGLGRVEEVSGAGEWWAMSLIDFGGSTGRVKLMHNDPLLGLALADADSNGGGA